MFGCKYGITSWKKISETFVEILQFKFELFWRTLFLQLVVSCNVFASQKRKGRKQVGGRAARAREAREGRRVPADPGAAAAFAAPGDDGGHSQTENDNVNILVFLAGRVAKI